VRPRLLFTLALLAIAACAANGVVASSPDDLDGTLRVEGSPGGRADLEVRLGRDAIQGDPAWMTVTAWQGDDDGSGDGLVVHRLEQAADGGWRTTEPVPVADQWKTMVRLHDGRTLTALPVYLPEDSALGEPEVPAEDTTRPFGEEKLLLQRELDDDVPGWLWLAAGSVVLLCSLALVLGLGWGVGRFARATRPQVGSARTSVTV
jgi:hypothetical protein